jgi:hypothetical protein
MVDLANIFSNPLTDLMVNLAVLAHWVDPPSPLFLGSEKDELHRKGGTWISLCKIIDWGLRLYMEGSQDRQKIATRRASVPATLGNYE